APTALLSRRTRLPVVPGAAGCYDAAPRTGVEGSLVGPADFKSVVPREQRGRWVRFPCAPATRTCIRLPGPLSCIDSGGLYPELWLIAAGGLDTEDKREANALMKKIDARARHQGCCR